MSDSDPLIAKARTWTEQGQDVVLVTVTDTWGSSPCPAGSRMVINEKAGFEGSVSGGCIETSVISESLEVLREGGHQVLEYGVSDDISFEAGLACGGTIHVLAEKLDDALLTALSGDRPFVRVSDLGSGAWCVLRGGAVEGALSPPDPVRDQALADGPARVIEDAGENGARRYFIHPHLPRLRLIIIGAVRIAQALIPMAAEAGFEVTVIDPRRAFSTPERFPDVTMIRKWPDKALSELSPDGRSAIITLTHDAEPDDMALGIAIRSDAFYVGALGSRRTHAKRTARLEEAGYSLDEMARIHAPIGLDLGARSPGEIAVSIIAEIIVTRHGKRRTGG